MMSPALGVDNGSYEPGYKDFFEGVFVSPHVVAQAKKLVVLTSAVMTKLGYETIPTVNDTLSDIVCCIKFNDKNNCNSRQNCLNISTIHVLLFSCIVVVFLFGDFVPNS